MADAYDIKYDDIPMQTAVNNLVAKQIPFATALATSRTAYDAMEALRDDYPKSFVERSNWPIRQMAYVQAKKNKPVAFVGSKHNEMLGQTFGSIKKWISIPVHVKRGKSRKISKKQYPKMLLRKPKHFIGASPKTGQSVVWRRKTKKRFPIVPLWVFANDMPVEKRWDLMRITTKTVKKTWEKNAITALIQALDSAK